MEKWSAASLRRAGLCADHFSPSSFKGEDKKKLKRDAISIKFNGCSQKESETMNTGTKRSMQNLTQTETLVEIDREKITNNNVEIVKSCSQYNVVAQSKQPFKTYHSAQLNFDISEEEENIMEWIQLEPPINPINPPINQKVNSCYVAPVTSKVIDNTSDKLQFEITINRLKKENARLHGIIRVLKYRLHARKVCKRVTSKKSKKRIIKNLINEQNLHPVAKAMINLQLHEPKAP